MSTKIYTACRAPKRHAVRFIDHFHDAMMRQASAFAEQLMATVTKKAIGKVPAWIEGDAEGERLWERCKRFSVVEQLMRAAAKTPYHDPFDVSCGFNFWIYGTHVYAIPIGPSWAAAVMAPTALPDWAEDYSYYDNVDEPVTVTRAEWKRRGRVWGSVCTGKGKASHNARRLYHEVIDAKDGMGLFDFKWRLVDEAFHRWAEKRRR